MLRQKEKKLIKEPVVWSRHTARRELGIVGYVTFSLAVLFLTAFSIFSETAKFRFDNWTTDSGLPQNSVSSIAQTHDGYLWLTTFDGLVRFDGVRFTVFDKSSTPGISGNRFTKLLEDSRGTLWIGSEYGALVSYTGGEFKSYGLADGLPGEAIQSIYQEADGALIVSTLNQSYIRRIDGKFEPYPDGAIAPRRLYLAPSGSRWVLDPNGLHEFRDGKQTDYPVFTEYPIAFCEDRQGALWFSSGANIYRAQNGHITFYTPHGKPEAVVGRLDLELPDTAIYDDGQGNLWIGVNNSLILFNPSDASRQTFETGYAVRSIFSDREGNIWLGSDGGGLTRIGKKFITVYSKNDGMKSDNVYPVLEDTAHNVWLGADNLIRISSGVVTNYDLVGRGIPQSLFEDREGRLWAGFIAGLGFYVDGKFTDLTPVVGRRSYVVIRQDRAGNMWFGTDSGLVRFNGSETNLYTTENGLPNDEIKDIYEDAGGKLWIATYGGLVQFVDDKFSNYTERDGLVSNRVRTILGEPDGTLWLGTYDGGLSRFRDGKFVNYTTADGLFNNGVFRILEDAHGYFWINSNRGIYRIAKQQLNDFADRKIFALTSSAYGKQDGVLNTEGNGGRQPAGIKTHDGRLWFPTQKGVVVIDPEAVPFNPLPPPVLLETVKIDGNKVSPGQEIELHPGQSNLEIDYTGLSLTKSDQIRFKYKLEGLDNDWIDAGTRRIANYSYLPPGDYKFRVIAANSDGVWNETGADFQVRVLPSFWKTWYFYCLVAASLMAVACLIYWRRVSQLLGEKRRQEIFSRQLIESQELERKRLAAELHDSLSQNLVIIKNRAMMIITADKDIKYASDQAEEIVEMTDDSLSEVREIVQALRPSQIDRFGLTKTIEALAARTDSAKLRMTAQVEDIDQLLMPEMEINLYRIVQEALNNILKHSEATTACISIKRINLFISVEISDNGKGFDTAEKLINENTNGRHFGLINIYERAKILGCVPLIESGSQGTKIRLKISF